MFSVTQTVTQSVRLNATVSKRDVTRRYEEVLLLKVFSACVGSIIHFALFSSFRYTSFFPLLNARMLSGARAHEGERRLHSSRLQTPFAVKASFVPSFRRKESVNKVWYLSRRDMDNWKEWKRDIARVLNCPITVNTFLLQKRTRQQPSHAKRTKNNKHFWRRRRREKRGKKISFFFKAVVFFTLLCTHSVALSFVLFFLNRSGGNFSAPPRDDSETFKTSVAGQSNWNAYEGSSEKELTPEEKKAKAKAEEDASNARRAAAAAKMQAEREKAGYKGSIF